MIEYNLKFSKHDNDLLIDKLKENGYDDKDIEKSIKKFIMDKLNTESIMNQLFGIKDASRDSFIIDDIPARFDEITVLNIIDDDNYYLSTYKLSIDKKEFLLQFDVNRKKEALFDLMLRDIKKYVEKHGEEFVNINDTIFIRKDKIANVESNEKNLEIEIILKNKVGSYKLPRFNTINEYYINSIKIDNCIIENNLK